MKAPNKRTKDQEETIYTVFGWNGAAVPNKIKWSGAPSTSNSSVNNLHLEVLTLVASALVYYTF
jgi:hypothetical protein